MRMPLGGARAPCTGEGRILGQPCLTARIKRRSPGNSSGKSLVVSSCSLLLGLLPCCVHFC